MGLAAQLTEALAGPSLNSEAGSFGPSHQQAVFVPLHPWDDGMELCREPRSRVCWHDIVSVVSGGAEEAAIRATPVPSGWVAAGAKAQGQAAPEMGGGSSPVRVYGTKNARYGEAT